MRGARPIGLCPSIFQVALKARKRDDERFEVGLDRSFFSVAKRISPADVTWRLAVEAEAEVKRGARYSIICWDLTRMYDMLGRQRLCARAISLRMPRQVALATLASYRWPRLTMLEGAVAEAISPTRGIMPGCPGACAWAKVALVECLGEILHEAKAASPNLRLNVHVDDITVALAAAAGEQLLGPLLETMRRIQLAVEHEVQGVISPGKSGVLASSPAMGKALRRGLGTLGASLPPRCRSSAQRSRRAEPSGTAGAGGSRSAWPRRQPRWVV